MNEGTAKRADTGLSNLSQTRADYVEDKVDCINYSVGRVIFLLLMENNRGLASKWIKIK